MSYRSTPAFVRGAIGIHDRLAASHPKLVRNQVWCLTCGRTEHVDSGDCIRTGWPRCCGATMTVDAPEERAP